MVYNEYVNFIDLIGRKFMNKKLIAGVMALTMVFGGAVCPMAGVAGITAVTASAEDVNSNGLRYTVYKDHAEVVGRASSGTVPGNLSIPSSMNGVPVTKVKGLDNGKLTSLTIPDSVTEISAGAFANNKNLKTVKLGKKVSVIGEGAFRECSALTGITIPDSVNTIGVMAFWECKGLTKAVIGNGVTQIGNGAFVRCGKLSSLTIGKNVKTIGENAFYSCAALTSVKLPDTVTKVGDEAFGYCSNLKTIDLGKNLTVLPSELFHECDKLQSVKLPAKLKKINNECFYHCVSLKTLNIPDGTTELSHSFLDCCKGMTVTIPASVTKISEYAFNGTENITVKGYSGSQIESFVKKHNSNASNRKITFVSLGKAPQKKGSPGDVNLDGEINVTDIAQVASHIKGIKALTGDGLKNANVNGDGQVNVTDIAMIASHIKGIKALS